MDDWDESKEIHHALRSPERWDACNGKVFYDMTSAEGEDALDGLKVDRSGKSMYPAPVDCGSFLRREASWPNAVPNTLTTLHGEMTTAKHFTCALGPDFIACRAESGWNSARRLACRILARHLIQLECLRRAVKYSNLPAAPIRQVVGQLLAV